MNKKNKNKLDFGKEGDSLVGILLIRAMTDALKPKEDIGEKFKSLDGSNLDVRILVNGVEAPFKSCMTSLERHFDEEVAKEAKVLIEDKIEEGLNKVNQAFNEMADDIREKFKNFI